MTKLGSAVVRGLIAPLKAAPETLTDYTRSSLEAFTTEGKLYGYPKAVETLVLYYNKDLLKNPLEPLDDYHALSAQIHNQDPRKFGLLGKFDDIYYAYGAMAAYGGYIFLQEVQGNYKITNAGLYPAGSIGARH